MYSEIKNKHIEDAAKISDCCRIYLPITCELMKPQTRRSKG